MNKLRTFLLIILLASITFSSCLVVEVQQPTPPLSNALYLEHAWADREMTTLDIQQLDQHMEQGHIEHVLLHVGPLEEDGGITVERYVTLAENIEKIRSLDPAPQIHAWLGQIESRGGGPLDLTKLEVREKVVETALVFIDDFEVDGIHINIEPVITEDDSLTSILKDIKSRHPETTVSLATTPLEPMKGIHTLSKLWREDGLFMNVKEIQKLSEHADILMVMPYDTGIDDPVIYQTFVSLVTSSMAQARMAPQTKLWIGIPTYEDQRSNFNPMAENIATGLTGYFWGLDGLAERHRILGAAYYANWTTDETEWQQASSIIQKQLAMPSLE